MSGGVRLKLHTADLDQAVRRAKRACINMSNVWEDIGQEAVDSVQATFDAEGRPRRWVKWSISYGNWRAENKPGSILTVSGQLRNSINYRSDNSKALVGTNKVYAAIHNFGGKTRPHVIKPRNAKALFWPGASHPVKFVNHPGSKVPQREFLVIQDHDWVKFASKIEKHITEPFNG